MEPKRNFMLTDFEAVEAAAEKKEKMFSHGRGLIMVFIMKDEYLF